MCLFIRQRGVNRGPQWPITVAHTSGLLDGACWMCCTRCHSSLLCAEGSDYLTLCLWVNSSWGQNQTRSSPSFKNHSHSFGILPNISQPKNINSIFSYSSTVEVSIWISIRYILEWLQIQQDVWDAVRHLSSVKLANDVQYWQIFRKYNHKMSVLISLCQWSCYKWSNYFAILSGGH